MTEPTAGADNYLIGREIARGGMGSILEAEDAKLGRTVAVKVMLLDANADAGARRRFLREAEVLALLAHPNIVPIYDIVWEDGMPLFYSMKLVKGRTLQDILHDFRRGDPAAQRDYTLAHLLLIFRKVCDAIAFAHSKGILHRDLKPANVMAGEFGEVMVMDWGLAKQMQNAEPTPGDRRSQCKMNNDGGGTDEADAATPLSSFSLHPASFAATLAGAVMGTPQYMSPEQATGDLAALDERSDIFTLGGMLYAILTLRPPVEGDSLPEMLGKITSGSIAAPVQVNVAAEPGGKRVPPALSAVAMKALRLNRAERYQSVAALSADIEAWQNGFSTSAEEAGAMKQIKLLMLRHKTVTAALAALLLVSVGFLLKVMASERKATTNAVIAVQEKESARRALARSQISLTEAAYREDDGIAMLAALESVPPDLRDADWRYLRSRADTSQAKVAFADGVWFGGVAADPRQPGVFAAASQDHTVAFVEAKTGRRLSGFPLSARQSRYPHYKYLDFSPDGARLIVGGLNDAGVGIYDSQSGRCLVEWDAFDTAAVRFSRDGARILEGSIHHEVKIRDAATGQSLWQCKSVPFAVFTRGGDVITAEADRLRVLHHDTGAVVRELPRARGAVRDLALSPDGGTLFVVTDNSTVQGLKMADGSDVFEGRLTQRAGQDRISLALGSGGRTVVAASWQADGFRTIRAWDTKTGALLKTLLGSSGMMEGFAVHPLSDDVIVTGPDTRTWTLATRAPVWTGRVEANSRAAGFWNTDDILLTGNGIIRLPATGDSASTLWQPPQEIRGAVRADAAGDFAAAGKMDASDSIIVVLRRSGDTITTLHTLRTTTGLNLIRMSTGGARFAAANAYNQLDIYDTATGQQLHRCDAASFATIDDLLWIGPDRILGAGTHGVRSQPDSDERLVLWDAATGQPIRELPGLPAMHCLALAPGQRRFAAAGPDKTVYLRDAQTLALLHQFRAHDGAVTALAFHPAKPILATGSADLTIRLWNLGDGSLIEELRSAKQPRSLRFCPGGQRLLSSDAGGAVTVWNL